MREPSLDPGCGPHVLEVAEAGLVHWR